jgi:3-oxoacyl-(acyl-carrier-protein) synthase
MDDMAREWVNARLEATEERMNARLSGIEASLKVLVGDVGALANSMNAVRVKTDAIESAQSNTKYWIIGTAITLLLGTVGSVVAVLAFGLQAFDAARSLIEMGQSLPK